MGGSVLKLKSEEPIEQGFGQGIEAFNLDKLEDDCLKDKIIARLRKRFQLTDERAEYYFQRFGTTTA